MNPLRHWTGRYGLALLAVTLAAILRLLIPDVLSRAPYLGFYPAVVVAAILGGLGPGLLATFGSMLLVNFVFIQFNFFDYGLQMRNVIWIIGGVGVSFLAGQMLAANRRIEQFNTELEDRIEAQTAEMRVVNTTLEQRIAARTGELEAANLDLQRSHQAALNLVQDVIDAHKQAEQAASEVRRHNEELLRLNNAMTGRELRMVELKKEINDLCERLGQQKRYNLDFDKDKQ
jgi:K+-sensing histidine kinase KdpD